MRDHRIQGAIHVRRWTRDASGLKVLSMTPSRWSWAALVPNNKLIQGKFREMNSVRSAEKGLDRRVMHAENTPLFVYSY